jgi:hypothetical protein
VAFGCELADAAIVGVDRFGIGDQGPQDSLRIGFDRGAVAFALERLTAARLEIDFEIEPGTRHHTRRSRIVVKRKTRTDTSW